MTAAEKAFRRADEKVGLMGLFEAACWVDMSADKLAEYVVAELDVLRVEKLVDYWEMLSAAKLASLVADEKVALMEKW